MKKWNLKIMLKSDLCAATGEDAPGITNIKTATEYGIPYIPAKRMKGCLLNEGKEMRDNGLVEQAVLERIFGRTGAQRAEGIYISDAHLCSVPGYLFGDVKEQPIEIHNYNLFQNEVQKCHGSEIVYFEEFFTRMRTRTALDQETGSARKHSLRTMQVVPAGINFVCGIEGELDEEEEMVLRNCAKGLRHIGMGITRGLGEVRCVLEAVETGSSVVKNVNVISDEKVQVLNKFNPKEKVVLRYELTLDSPIVVEGTNDCISGGMILGSLAGMYIKKYSLGGEAHTDENFSRIFLNDGVQFGYGFLKRNEKTYIPCPSAIAEMKEDKGKWFHIEDDKECKRRDIHGLVRWEGKELHQLSPIKEIHFHHSRPVNRGMGHAINDRAVDTSLPAGEFFQYTALTKGQTFAGSWSGNAEDIQRLAECLQDYGYRMRLGKSKTAEYGNCTFKIVDILQKRDCIVSPLKGTAWMLWFISPMVCLDERTGEYTLDEDVLKKQLGESLGCNVKKLEKIAGGYTTYSGYNSKWRLPSVSCPAIATGSTYYLETDREVQSCEIQGERWGTLIGNGCGQVAVRPWNVSEKGKIIPDFDKMTADGLNKKETGGSILVDRLLSLREERLKCERIAIEKLDCIDAEKLPPSSAIELLSHLLRSYRDSDIFYSQIVKEAEQIRKSDKKTKVLKFLEPCKGESYEFMKIYLENAKWKARCRGKDE